MSSELISIIIPVLNEATTINKCLTQFKSQPPTFEIIIVDGGSTDKTKELAGSFPNVKIVDSAKGRGRQMNAGAQAAKGNILLFLHSDTILPFDGLNLIRRAVKTPGAVGGYFQLEHDENSFWYEHLSYLINWRSSLPNIIPYGDQAIFCNKDAFKQVGGYKNIAIMEDYDFAKRLKKSGRLIKIDEKVKNSFRRYKKGVIRYMLICNLIWWLYHLGVSPNFLKKLYKDVR